MTRVSVFAAVPLGLSLTTLAAAQKVDYHKADLIRTSYNYVFGGDVQPTFLEDSVRFWYTSASKADHGVVYVVDPRAASRKILFDNARLAAALSLATDTILDPSRLPMFKVVDGAVAIELPMFRKKPWRCEVASYKCVALDSAEYALKQQIKDGPEWASRSPDKKWDVFRYDFNLYARSAARDDSDAVASKDSALRARRDTTKKDTTKAATKARADSAALPAGSVQLTTDGIEHFGYGAGMLALFLQDQPRWKPVRPEALVWAPDSRKFSVERMDVRNVRKYPMYSSTGDQPVDKSYIYAAPSDSIVPMFDVHVIDVAGSANVRVQQTKSPAINFSSSDAWGKTSDHLYLVNSGRGYHRMSILSVDPKSGATKEIMRDSSATWLDYGLVFNGTFRVIDDADVFWLSERDGFPHVYRYAPDGTLKNQVDVGPYSTESIVKIDSVAKQLYLLINGREPANPYYTQLYRVNFDGSGMTLLTPEPGSRRQSFVPKAPFFIDSYSRPDTPPITVLRSSETGRVVMELARGDAEYLHAVGWTPPEVIQVKARDGVTDIYGLLYKPSNFDPKKVYPIIDHIYPGPFIGSTSGYGFAGTGEPRALAELGFIVVEIDHMGSPWRSKSFTDNYVNNMIDNGIPDHVAGIKQLAAKYPWIDINRVGIYGHSGGGYASTDAIFRFPDFYKVAVSGAGNHNPNTYGYFWAERYLGPYDKAKYEASANFTYAKNLKGHLLLMHGDMDNNVHPANTLKVVDALIKANKNFDMIIFPDANHGLPTYEVRKRWDYFVKWLLGAEPPEDYEMMEVRY